MSDYDNEELGLPIGYLLDNCNDWDSFCLDTGLNPWCLNEGLAKSEDLYYVTLGILKKHGIFPSDE